MPPELNSIRDRLDGSSTSLISGTESGFSRGPHTAPARSVPILQCLRSFNQIDSDGFRDFEIPSHRKE